ncbi:Bax inhibitor-1/YccA family protein [Kitasatospora sp. MBT63]|uniref:Bax inhibitor-1/YccA family protein n=1 Tax=Kitasatospora sp. MBT63 TaxID=1444768 RepID=UPI00053B78D5|nr:Bax inhibitor-1/YccA family protein [Kitasatospora sp. MBT63]
MRSSNPVFSRDGAFSRDTGYAGFDTTRQQPYGADPYANNPYANDPYGQQPHGGRPTDEQLATMYRAPSAGPLDTGRMTMDDVVARTAICLLTLLGVGAAAWFTVPVGNFGLAIGASLAAFVLGLVINFKRSISPALILLYAALQGLALGVVSRAFETFWDGIVIQAVLGTVVVSGGMLLAYKSGWIRVTGRYARIGTAIALGFSFLAMIDFLAWTAGADLGLGSGPLGLLFGLGGVAVGAFLLSLDFAEIEAGIRGGAPQAESWRAAFGLVVALIWIYVYLLRVIAILRGDD